MTYVKILTSILNSPRNLLIIKGKTTFDKTFTKIINSKNSQFVWVKQSVATQMAAVILARIIGKKSLWIQSFSNPPEPSFVCRLLLNQADEIIVSGSALARKLKKFGIDKPKIRLLR